VNTVPFGSLFEFIRNGMSIKQDKNLGGLPISRIETIADAVIDPERVGFAGLNEEDSAGWLLQHGDILFSHINSVEHIGKCAVYRGQPEKLVHGMNLLCLRPDKSRVMPEFVKYLIRGTTFRSQLNNYINKSVNQASVSIGNLKPIPVPLPPLSEQRRIAAVLDAAEALRAKRRAALAQLDSLTQAIFIEMFGDLREEGRFPIKLLSECAEVVSGVAKGRRFNGHPTVFAPYLRVANVQAGYLNLDEIKTIEVMPREVEELSLKAGDVVMTEGGDFDKLGRGALWNGQIAGCVHQNHVFRVRLNLDRLVPQFFHDFLQTDAARAYFLRCAKKTTNLASINMTQLRKLPTPLPPKKLQNEFARRTALVESTLTKHQESLERLDTLFASLQHRAFRGEL
jgi:type I restriction enzyme S subunit